MSEMVKLIIEIPEDYYRIMKHDVEHHLTDYRPFEIIGNGIPLDDVKAEIKQKAWDTQEIDGEHENYKVVYLSDVLQILDNIGKAESEGS